MKIGTKKAKSSVCWLAAYFLLVTASVLWPAAIHAHPHVFIVQRINAVFDDNGLAGFRMWWKFDDMFASMIAEDHDLNRNGQFEPNEVQIVKEKAFSYIAESSYFIFIKIDGQPFQVKWVKDFNAVLKDGRMVYEFFVPCHVTAVETVKTITVATYDPTYYSAIFFTQGRPVSLTSAEAYDVKAAIREDPDTKIYFDMVHPWALFLEFRRRA